MFVGSRLLDKVYAIVDKAKPPGQANLLGAVSAKRLAFKDGVLYIAELLRISKVEKIDDNLDNPPKPVVIYHGPAKYEAHGWKFLTIGPDDKLYFQVGAPCTSVCRPAHAQIRRINLDGSGAEVVARASARSSAWTSAPSPSSSISRKIPRLAVGRHPSRKAQSADPAQQATSYPYCHHGNIADQEFRWGHSATSSPSHRIAGPAYGRARDVVLYREYVPV